MAADSLSMHEVSPRLRACCSTESPVCPDSGFDVVQLHIHGPRHGQGSGEKCLILWRTYCFWKGKPI